jgi:hypothetical protein
MAVTATSGARPGRCATPALFEAVDPNTGRLPDSDPESDPDAHTLLALGLTPATAPCDIPERIHEISENARLTQAMLHELARPPLGDPQAASPTELGWPGSYIGSPTAILQPPWPEIVPASHVTAMYRSAARADASTEPERG